MEAYTPGGHWFLNERHSVKNLDQLHQPAGIPVSVSLLLSAFETVVFVTQHDSAGLGLMQCSQAQLDGHYVRTVPRVLQQPLSA